MIQSSCSMKISLNTIRQYIDFEMPPVDELVKRINEQLGSVKEAAKLLGKAFDTPRVALIFEGTGVAHVYAKLIPLHGELAGQTDVWSKETEFYEQYRGWLTTVEGPKMDDARLDEIQAKIKAVQ